MPLRCQLDVQLPCLVRHCYSSPSRPPPGMKGRKEGGRLFGLLGGLQVRQLLIVAVLPLPIHATHHVSHSAHSAHTGKHALHPTHSAAHSSHALEVGEVLHVAHVHAALRLVLLILVHPLVPVHLDVRVFALLLCQKRPPIVLCLGLHGNQLDLARAYGNLALVHDDCGGEVQLELKLLAVRGGPLKLEAAAVGGVVAVKLDARVSAVLHIQGDKHPVRTLGPVYCWRKLPHFAVFLQGVGRWVG
mmetsp:Transcript_35072/g.99444  ORF Transcript_35072/g.99444 Transcript_35072/m.99444 type:complete len:245 (+) Transcript_35072:201-935(+)